MITGKKLAELAGCSPAGVSKATKAGLIPRDESGLYDPSDKRILAWMGDSSRKKGLPSSGGVAALKSAVIESRRSEESSFLLISADFGDGFRPVIRYRFDKDQYEGDSFIYPVPAPVAVALREIIGQKGYEPVVYLLEDSKVLPTRMEDENDALERVRFEHREAPRGEADR